jgi:hypothetical protein
LTLEEIDARLAAIEALLVAVLGALGVEAPPEDPAAAAFQKFRERARKEGAARG